ncbi:MAG: hypothetical protein FWC01_01585 [Treponema sp.]|nr:hypothetical protein [Treponema sp.]MCL2236806.1 hypothetical protein [Treponema sp.]
MKRFLLFIFILIVTAMPSFSQEEEPEKPVREAGLEPERKMISGDFWLGPSFDMAMYTSGGFNMGGGFSFGYGKGASIGLKVTYLFDNEYNYNVLELLFLFRIYFFGRDYCSGPFIQFAGGQSLFFRQDDVSLPANWGIFAGGINIGWRIHLGKIFYIEPAFNAGYPFFLSFAFSLGVHF